MSYYGYRQHDNRGRYRWWYSENPGDMFDVLGKEAFEKAKASATIKVIDLDDLEAFCNAVEDGAARALKVMYVRANRDDLTEAFLADKSVEEMVNIISKEAKR